MPSYVIDSAVLYFIFRHYNYDILDSFFTNFPTTKLFYNDVYVVIEREREREREIIILFRIIEYLLDT